MVLSVSLNNPPSPIRIALIWRLRPSKLKLSHLNTQQYRNALITFWKNAILTTVLNFFKLPNLLFFYLLRPRPTEIISRSYRTFQIWTMHHHAYSQVKIQALEVFYDFVSCHTFAVSPWKWELCFGTENEKETKRATRPQQDRAMIQPAFYLWQGVQKYFS